MEEKDFYQIYGMDVGYEALIYSVIKWDIISFE